MENLLEFLRRPGQMLDEDDPAIESFQNLGTGLIPRQLEGLERFVCRVYCSSGPSTLPALRWEMFRFRKERVYLLHVLPFFPKLHSYT